MGRTSHVTCLPHIMWAKRLNVTFFSFLFLSCLFTSKLKIHFFFQNHQLTNNSKHKIPFECIFYQNNNNNNFVSHQNIFFKKKKKVFLMGYHTLWQFGSSPIIFVFGKNKTANPTNHIYISLRKLHNIQTSGILKCF
jgi:hypothetical protein